MVYDGRMVTDAQRIRVIRAYMGLESQVFADKLGVSRVTLTAWEAGRSVPGLRGGAALAKVMKKAKLVLRPDGYPVPKG